MLMWMVVKPQRTYSAKDDEVYFPSLESVDRVDGDVQGSEIPVDRVT